MPLRRRRVSDATGAKIVQGYGLADPALAIPASTIPRAAAFQRPAHAGHRASRARRKRRSLPQGQIHARTALQRRLHRRPTACAAPGATGSSARRYRRITADGCRYEGARTLIIRGGQNISAFESRTILCRHPASPTRRWCRMPDAEMWRRACASSNIRRARAWLLLCCVRDPKWPPKIPGAGDTADFPMTAAGNKVDKRWARLEGAADAD